MTETQGFCDEKFAPLREAFEKCFKEHGDIGASFAVTKDREYVADLWGGYLDQERTRPWLEDTIVNVYSSTKTMMALVALVLSDRGEIDLYAPVCRYWPEFASNGKERIEVRHLLSQGPPQSTSVSAAVPSWSLILLSQAPVGAGVGDVLGTGVGAAVVG